MEFISKLANPERFMRVSQWLLPIFAVLAFICLIGGGIWALGFSPADFRQGDTVKIMYVHVPAAWMSMATYAIMGVASFVGFVWRHTLADIAARQAAPMGFAFTLLALMTGSVWGQLTWGVWWDWDARMTSMLVLLFIYAGYMVIWQVIENETQAARLAAILCMVGVINLPIIKFSVDFWESLHQEASIIRADGPSMPASMYLPLLAMALGYTFLFSTYLLMRMRTVILMKRRGSKTKGRAPSIAKTVAGETV